MLVIRKRLMGFLVFSLLYFQLGFAPAVLIREEKIDAGLLDNLRAYHGVTAVLQTAEDADGYGGLGYNGLLNFFMVADQRDTTQILWYATCRFMPLSEPMFSTKHTNVFWSNVRVGVNMDPTTYRRVYGEYGGNMDRLLRASEKCIFRFDRSLGDAKMNEYQDRKLFQWPIEGRNEAGLPAGFLPIQENREYSHTTLQDFVGHILGLRSSRIGGVDFFPHYSLSGVAWKCDALNCVSFSLRVLQRLGVNVAGSPQLRRYLQYEYKDVRAIWNWTGLSYVRYLTWDGPFRAYPDRVIYQMFCHFLGKSPKEIKKGEIKAPFVGNFSNMLLNFPNCALY